MTASPTLTITLDPITAGIRLLEHGVEFCAPVICNGVTLIKTGSWSYGVDARDPVLLGQALDDCVTTLVATSTDPDLYHRWTQALEACS